MGDESHIQDRQQASCSQLGHVAQRDAAYCMRAGGDWNSPEVIFDA